LNTTSTLCTTLENEDLPIWDRFVHGHPSGTVYHLSVWREILADAFGKAWYLVAAMQNGKIRAGLPLVHMKSRLFGNFLVSMPYFNYGGILTEEDALAEGVLQHAVALGRALGINHVELRHIENHYPKLPARHDKVSMWLSLPATAEELMQSFKAKLRSQIRKGGKNNLAVQVGRTDLLDDFFTVFTKNMRNLGTPAYGQRFFSLILETFPKSARIIVVRGQQGIPVAAGFLLGYRDRLEIPWASSLPEFNHLQSNMWLYWNCLKYACDHGYRVFDFGRSTLGGSTYRFKEQWCAKPVPHFWHYYLEGSQTLPRLNPDNPKFRLAIALWRRLPLSLTRLLGPAIIKHLP
jgi:serine/alanine adding enzyme